MTTGLQFVIGWWYRKTAVFYLPPGWFGPLTWWLAFPFAPAGSVSCGVWQMACKRVIKVGERVVKEVLASHGECSSQFYAVPPVSRTRISRVESRGGLSARARCSVFSAFHGVEPWRGWGGVGQGGFRSRSRHVRRMSGWAKSDGKVLWTQQKLIDTFCVLSHAIGTAASVPSEEQRKEGAGKKSE